MGNWVLGLGLRSEFMVKHVVILCGLGNSGKSRTLRELFDYHDNKHQHLDLCLILLFDLPEVLC